MLAGVLLDLSMTATLSSSLDVGQKVLGNMGRITPLHKRRVEQAGFMVLKSPDIPSILVETGFISNANEAAKLATKSHQQALPARSTLVCVSISSKALPGLTSHGCAIAARLPRDRASTLCGPAKPWP